MINDICNVRSITIMILIWQYTYITNGSLVTFYIIRATIFHFCFMLLACQEQDGPAW